MYTSSESSSSKKKSKQPLEVTTNLTDILVEEPKLKKKKKNKKNKEKDEIVFTEEFLKEHVGDIPRDKLQYLRTEWRPPDNKSKKVAMLERDQDQYLEKLKYYDAGDFNFDEKLEEKENKKAKFGIRLSFGVNVLLTVVKIIVLIQSGSISILASLLDSILDLVSGSILFISSRLQQMTSKEFYKYPVGKRRLETITVVVFSVAMFAASAELLVESVQRLTNPDSIDLSFDYVSISLVTAIIVIKFLLWLYCRTSTSSIVLALAQDHRNDVFTNAIGIICGVIGYYFWKFLDPIGAIILAIMIMINWAKTGTENVKLMVGRSADPQFLSMLTYITYNHDPRVLAVDTVRAYHVSNRLVVELDIILPGEMSLREAHDIGESLQKKVEKLSNVERAFVHLDFEFEHRHEDEHPTLVDMRKKDIKLVKLEPDEKERVDENG